jgi:hypothetical protein
MVTFGKFLDKNVFERRNLSFVMAGLMRLLAQRLNRLTVCPCGEVERTGVCQGGLSDYKSMVSGVVLNATFHLPIFCSVRRDMFACIGGYGEGSRKCLFPLVDAGVCLFKQWPSLVRYYTTRQCARGQR